VEGVGGPAVEHHQQQPHRQAVRDHHHRVHVRPALEVDLAEGGVPPGVWSYRRFRNRGTEYISESGIKWIMGSTKRQCTRAQVPPLLDPTVDVCSALARREAVPEPAHLLLLVAVDLRIISTGLPQNSRLGPTL
jgi:hypothetical protein